MRLNFPFVRQMADTFCTSSRKRVERLFEDMASNNDPQRYRLARDVLAGDYTWWEEGMAGVDVSAAAFRPEFTGGNEEAPPEAATGPESDSPRSPTS